MWWLWLCLAGAAVLLRLYRKATGARCDSDQVLTGKVAIVTGANAGIGYQTALGLARRGARVYLACRSDARGQEAERRVRAATGARQVHHLRLDLSSARSVRAFVTRFRSVEVRLDVLVNNAGALGWGTACTDDGLLEELQTNHYGPFLLSVLLAPVLRRTPSARVVFVSSVAHRFASVDPATLNAPFKRATYYGAWRVYSASKLCNVLVSGELSRRLPGVAVNSVHPGHVRTSLYKNVDSVAETFMNFILAAFFKTAEEGAQSVLWLCVSPEAEDVTGGYFVDCSPRQASAKARDPRLAAALWAHSERAVKLAPEECL